jgi:hypothetical protein
MGPFPWELPRPVAAGPAHTLARDARLPARRRRVAARTCRGRVVTHRGDRQPGGGYALWGERVCHREVQHALRERLLTALARAPWGAGTRASGPADLPRTWQVTFPGPGPRGRLIRPRPPAGRVAVRDKVGRTRYVAFRLEGGPLGRPALSGSLPATARLTRFDGTYGILRTLHRDRDALLAVLMEPRRVGDKEVRVVTLATSGTLKAAARALPAEAEAARRSPPKRD